MKLKLDENLPESLLPKLGGLGHDVDNVRVEGLSGQADADVWQADRLFDGCRGHAFLPLQQIRPMIETVPLANAAEAYGRMMRNEARFRIVLVTGL